MLKRIKWHIVGLSCFCAGIFVAAAHLFRLFPFTDGLSFFGAYLLLIVTQLVILCIFSRRVVPQGMIIIGENLLLRPGRKYFTCPFLRYDRTVIKEKMDISLQGFVFHCCDGEFRADCKTSVLLGFGKMRPERFFYRKDFDDLLNRQLKKFMDGSVAQLVQRENLAEIIRCGEKGAGEYQPLGSVDVYGLRIPICWDGKIIISNTKAL